MRHQIIKSENFIANSWSGGTTAELFIYPTNANYRDQNFEFRISTATVEVEESTFTALPGYARKLLVLEGETTLSHENQHTKTLPKFVVDAFDGGWKTTSKGCCTDFNVMTRAPFKSELKGITVDAEFTLNPKLYSRWLFIYCFSGAAIVSGLNVKTEVSKGDFLIFENLNNAALHLSAKTKSEVVVVEISE